MTAPLRRAHLRIWLVLSMIVLVLLAVGLAARRTADPVNPDLHWEQLR